MDTHIPDSSAVTSKLASSKTKPPRLRKAPRITGEPPTGFLFFVWIVQNWRSYWRELFGFAVVLFVMLLCAQIGTKLVFQFIHDQFATVTLKVITFNESTGDISLEFNNRTRAPVTVNGVYLTIDFTNTVPMKVLPAELQSQLSVFDRAMIRVPGGAAVEFGAVAGTGKTKGRPVKQGVILVHEITPLVLQPGITSTNLAPSMNAFTQLCEQYLEGADLRISLHTWLIDKKGRIRAKEISIGSYFIAHLHKGLRDSPYPKEIDILLGADKGGRGHMRWQFSVSGRTQLPSIPDNAQVALIENTTPAEILISYGQEIKGLVPAIFTRQSISYGCEIAADLEPNESLPADVGAWVLTRDDGKTVMNVPMAFSDRWSRVHAAPTAAREVNIPLTDTNWHILVEGERWARVDNITIRYTVTEQSWMKLLPPDDATYALLLSNYNIVASEDVSDDPTWIPLTNAVAIPTNSGTLLIMKSEQKPDLGMFTNLRMPSSTDAETQQVHGACGKPSAASR